MSKLESLVVKLGQRVIQQDAEIERLKVEVSIVITDQAIQNLTPWPAVGRGGPAAAG